MATPTPAGVGRAELGACGVTEPGRERSKGQIGVETVAVFLFFLRVVVYSPGYWRRVGTELVMGV